MLIRLASILTVVTMVENNNLSEKKLRGSGGYVLAKITEAEQKKGNLGGPDLFLAGVGRLSEDRFSKYYCNKCEKEFPGCPRIDYETPNEDLGEGIRLLETGEYKCAGCNNTISQYRKFSSPEASIDTSGPEIQHQASYDEGERSAAVSSPELGATTTSNHHAYSPTSKCAGVVKSSVGNGRKLEGFVPIQSLIGMPAYDSEAMLIGTVLELGLRKASNGKMDLSMKIRTDNDLSNRSTEVLWENISKIGDVVLLSTKPSSVNDVLPKCSSCGHENEEAAIFCEECGKKLI